MEWTDEGIVLGVRRHGESSAIVELLTREHGRHLGLVRGGAGSRMRPLLQPGNSVTAVWRARLDEHLGMYALEGTRLRAATLLASSHAVYGVTHLAALARLLPERDPHEDIYEMLQGTLDDFDDAGIAAVHLIRFELAMLTELGFGLDEHAQLREEGHARAGLEVAALFEHVGQEGRGAGGASTAGLVESITTALGYPRGDGLANTLSLAGALAAARGGDATALVVAVSRLLAGGAA